MTDLNTTSAMCMDILVDKPGFPDHAFVLYADGWTTMHVVVERRTIETATGPIRGARRENYGPSQTGRFTQDYVDRVYEAIAIRNSLSGSHLNPDEFAVIPFDGREQEVLALGDVVEANKFPDGVEVKTLSYRGRDGKRIKIYSPPQATLVEYLKD